MNPTQYAVIDTATRVIKYLTIDTNPQVASNNTVVALPSPIDIGNGMWKLDGSNNKIAASLSEWQQAGMDEAYKTQLAQTNYQSYKTALQKAITDASIPASINAFLVALQKIL